MEPEQFRQRVITENARLAQEAQVLSDRRQRLENLVMQQAILIERLEADLVERQQRRVV